MTKLKALNMSLRIWKQLAEGNPIPFFRSDGCPLCKYFYCHDNKPCPIFIDTGVRSCRETNYSKWYSLEIRSEVAQIEAAGMYLYLLYLRDSEISRRKAGKE
jgi:hypothetical protein